MNAIEPQNTVGELMEAVIARGDLSKLTPQERSKLYVETCRSLGLNPLTRPFEYLTLSGKMVLYARRDAADQLRKLHGINIAVVSHTVHDGLLTVHARATDRSGRTDEDYGVVSVGGLRGEVAANAFLKAVTKAKRRVTLSIAGLGFLDETEVEDIPAPEMTGHAFGHLAAPENAPLPSPPGPAAQEGPAPVPEPLSKGTPAAGAGSIPSYEDYLAKWEVMLEEAEPSQATYLQRQWNVESDLRRNITWPEGDEKAALRAFVFGRIEHLKRGSE